MSSNGDANDGLQGEVDDLFDDEVDEGAGKPRALDDEDLDSGDDEGRYDRMEVEDEAVPEEERRDINVIELELGRHAVPESSDGEAYLLKMPQFLSLDPTAFSLQAFQAPTTDHHSAAAEPNFSAYKTAQTTMRWRHSPGNPAELQSNARILRWSDGSLTLQLAADPTVQYEITHQALAPPQQRPKKPTPVSKPGAVPKPWSEKQDQFTYLASAHVDSFTVRTTNKMTAMLRVNTAGKDEDEDEALARLKVKMDAARGVTKGTADLIDKVEDPLQAHRQAEQAEKEMLRAQRRLENQQTRARERGGLGRSGGRPGGGGLTIGGLEEEGSGGGSRTQRKKNQKRMPRNDEYSDEEEQYGGGYNNRNDQYDEEDDFIAGSDEEVDAEGEEDDEDVDAILEAREKEQQGRRGGTPKHGLDRDAEGDDDDDEIPYGSPQAGRNKRRRVVDDDDDD